MFIKIKKSLLQRYFILIGLCTLFMTSPVEAGDLDVSQGSIYSFNNFSIYTYDDSSKYQETALDVWGVKPSKGLKSYVLEISQSNILGLDSLKYYLDIDTEENYSSGFKNNNYSFGISYDYDVKDHLNFNFSGEYNAVQDVNKNKEDPDYMTAKATLTWEDKGSFALSYTDYEEDEVLVTDKDWLFEATVGHSFDNGISVDLGYKELEEDGELQDVVGGVISYTHALKFK